MCFVEANIEVANAKEIMEENPLTDPRASISLDGTYADAHRLNEVEPELNFIKELSRAGPGIQGEFGYRVSDFGCVELHCLEELEKFAGACHSP
jgi:hypothetical protein